MKERRAMPLWSLLFALAFSATACVQIDDASTGRELYDQVCANCHANDLSGGIGPALGAESEVADRDDEYYRVTISRGRGRMPAFGSTLTDEQIQRVIDYLRSEQSG